MSRIQQAIESINKKGHKAFIPFITAGDPNIWSTKKFIKVLEEAGSTIIEIGIPFSDPIADGKVIQNANIRAMKQDMHLDIIFKMLEEVREDTQIPIVFLMYSNTIYHYGIENFFKRCKEVGVDGVIVPDVPIEEKEEFECKAKIYDVDWVRLVAPTSKERIKAICKEASGFIYCVSSLGVTGVRGELQTNLEEMLGEVKKYTSIPTAIGFGIATPAQALALKKYTEGIIVGSAIVKIIERYGEESEIPLKDYVTQMVEAMN